MPPPPLGKIGKRFLNIKYHVQRGRHFEATSIDALSIILGHITADQFAAYMQHQSVMETKIKQIL